MAPSRLRHVSGREHEKVEEDSDSARHGSRRGLVTTSDDGLTNAADRAEVVFNSQMMMMAEHQREREDEEGDVGRALKRLGTAMVRATTVGVLLKGGLNVFSLMARARKKGPSRAAAADAVRDTAAFAAFLVAFSGVYVGVDEGLAMRCGKQRSKGWRAAVAGGLAGPALLLADGGVGRGGGSGSQRHYGLATYIWMRSLVLLVRCGLERAQPQPERSRARHPDRQEAKHDADADADAAAVDDDKHSSDASTVAKLRRLLMAPFASRHADTALMMASATVILSCFINKPEALRGAYASFLNKHGGKSAGHYRAVQGVCLAKTNLETSEKVADAANALYRDDATARDALLEAAAAAAAAAAAPVNDPAMRRLRAKLYGMILHPGQSPAAHWLDFFANSLARSLAVNLPIYLVPALLVHRERLLGPRGPELFLRAAVGCARSSAFLSAYCATAWLGPAAVQRACGDMRWWTIACGVPAAGLAVMIEKPSRRQELGVYCASRAMEAAALCAVSWGWVPARMQGWRHDVALFSIAAAAIMHCYNVERDVFRSKYLNVLDFVFGNTGHGRQSIKHVGSFAVLANPPQMPSPAPGASSSAAASSRNCRDRTTRDNDGNGKEPEKGPRGEGGNAKKRTTLKTLLDSPERRKI